MKPSYNWDSFAKTRNETVSFLTGVAEGLDILCNTTSIGAASESAYGTPKWRYYENTNTFHDRWNECKTMKTKYPGRVPVICEPLHGVMPILPINAGQTYRYKFLIPSEFTICQFIYYIRKMYKLTAEKALFLSIDGKFPAHTDLISFVYQRMRSNDGFLYIKYSFENVFG